MADNPYIQRYGFDYNPYTGRTYAEDQAGTSLSSNSVGFDDLANAGSSVLNYLNNTANANNAAYLDSAERQMQFQTQQQQAAMNFNSEEAAKNRDWQEMMSNTAHQREVRDLLAAGLNPVLSAMNGNGASIGSGSSASVSMGSGASAQRDTSLSQALVSLFSSLYANQVEMEKANLSARTNESIAEKQMANALLLATITGDYQLSSIAMQGNNALALAQANNNYTLQQLAKKYGYDISKSYYDYSNQRKLKRDFPDTLYSTLNTILGGFGRQDSASSGVHDFWSSRGKLDGLYDWIWNFGKGD